MRRRVAPSRHPRTSGDTGVIGDIISAFTREFVQNGSFLPKAAKTAAGVVFAFCCLFYGGPVAHGVAQAGAEKAQQMMELFQPMIDNIGERAVPTSTATPEPEITPQD